MAPHPEGLIVRSAAAADAEELHEHALAMLEDAGAVASMVADEYTTTVDEYRAFLAGLEAWIDAGNRVSLSPFHKAGFQVEGRRRGAICRGGTYEDEILVGLLL